MSHPRCQDPDDGGGFIVNTVVAILSNFLIFIFWILRAIGRIAYETAREVKDEVLRRRRDDNVHLGMKNFFSPIAFSTSVTVRTMRGAPRSTHQPSWTPTGPSTPAMPPNSPAVAARSRSAARGASDLPTALPPPPAYAPPQRATATPRRPAQQNAQDFDWAAPTATPAQIQHRRDNANAHVIIRELGGSPFPPPSRQCYMCYSSEHELTYYLT